MDNNVTSALKFAIKSWLKNFLTLANIPTHFDKNVDPCNPKVLNKIWEIMYVKYLIDYHLSQVNIANA